MNFKEKLHKSKRIYKGVALDFFSDTIIIPDGKKSVREYTKHPGAGAVLAFIDKKRILLVRQYRYPVGKVTYELPAGKLSKGESPEKCIKRELEEETGYKAKSVSKFTSFWPTPAFSDEIIHIYIAKNLKKAVFCPDEDEFIRPEIIDIKKAVKWVISGKIKDSKTTIALLWWAANQKTLK